MFLAGKYVRRRMVLHGGSEDLIVMNLTNSGLSRSIIPCEVGGDYRLRADERKHLKDRDEPIHLAGARRLYIYYGIENVLNYFSKSQW